MSHVCELIQRKHKHVKNWTLTTNSTEFLKLKRKNYIIYKFKNKITNEVFEGLQSNFYKKYNLGRSSVGYLISGKYKTCKNWILI